MMLPGIYILWPLLCMIMLILGHKRLLYMLLPPKEKSSPVRNLLVPRAIIMSTRCFKDCLQTLECSQMCFLSSTTMLVVVVVPLMPLTMLPVAELMLWGN
jgi:hypothetical protein